MRRTKFIVGSLFGAVAIQLAVTACGVAMQPDAGDASTLDDVRSHADEGVLDALADTARDVAADALDTTSDAHAQDGGNCGCSTAARTTFNGSATSPGGGIRAEGSTASMGANETLAAGGAVELSWVVGANGFVGVDQRFSLFCQFRSNASGQGVRFAPTEVCRYTVYAGPDASGTPSFTQTTSTMLPIVSGFSGTGVTITLPSLTGSGYAFNAITVTHSAPGGGFPYTQRAYTP